MALFSRSELQTLTNQQTQSPGVSIYLPTHEAGAEVQQDPIRLKNQLSEAEKQLSKQGMGAKEIQTLLKPAADLISQQFFWQQQQQGLALFLAPNYFQYYDMPVEAETFVSVGQRFYTKPLLPLLTSDELFYVLAASQNQVTLYQATRSQVQPVDLGDTPRSLEIALRYDDPSESLQGHGTGKGGSQRIFHGQGGGKDSENSDILRFFHLVSNGVEKVLGGQTAPLVFVGLGFLFPIYQQANKYPYLMENAVDFQPDQLSEKEVRDRALEIVTPHFNADRKQANEQYGNLLNQDKATSDLAQILHAAYNGQIDTLFVDKSAQVWGQFDKDNRRAKYHDKRTATSDELLTLAISKALASDAKVYILEADELPAKGHAVATLRYPIMMEAQTAAVA